MIRIEDLGERMDEEALEELGIDNYFKWKPIPIYSYTVPPLVIDEVSKEDTKAYNDRNKKYGKILTFIYRMRRFRFKDACTEIPIPSEVGTGRYIWGSSRNVRYARDYMEHLGLIRDTKRPYRFGAGRFNKCKVYWYYKENEDKFIDYCKQNNISRFVDENYDEAIVLETECDNINIEDVIFSSRLRLIKPDTWTDTQFEKYLLSCLYHNYPDLKLHQQMADDINRMYYKDYPEFQIRFRPKFTWDKNKRYVRKIGIRATNQLCNVEKGTRKELIQEYNFKGEKDVKSSVPRLTIGFNTGEWLDESIDIYRLIYEEMEEDEAFSMEKREAIKALFMRAYFDGSEKELGAHLWNSINHYGLEREQIYAFAKKLKDAVIKVCGENLYGNEIFFIESCVYMDVLYDLLSGKLKVWEVYDCFYYNMTEMDGVSVKQIVTDLVRNNFILYVRRYKR